MLPFSCSQEHSGKLSKSRLGWVGTLRPKALQQGGGGSPVTAFQNGSPIMLGYLCSPLSDHITQDLDIPGDQPLYFSIKPLLCLIEPLKKSQKECGISMLFLTVFFFLFTSCLEGQNQKPNFRPIKANLCV